MNHSNQVTIEKQQRFSQSVLWQAQRSYYEEQGVDAWTEEVPCFITSNSMIAHSYANLVASFVEDWNRRHPEGSQQPFYLVEIGAGHGQFSYCFLKQIQMIFKSLGIEQPPIRYVMTDFTMNNISFWQEHRALREWVDAGVLDFARFDFENDATMHLIESGDTLTSDHFHKPIIVFANYLFDSIVNDVFHIKGGELKESLVSLSTDASNLKEGVPCDWEKVQFSYDNQPASPNYYSDPDFNALLQRYQRHLEESYLQFPVGSLQGIRNCQQLANGKMLLLSSDKGYVKLGELDQQEEPELAFHGSFSLMVNFDAIGEYCRLKGGDYKIPLSVDGFVSGLFTTNLKLSDYPLTNRTLSNEFMTFGPAEYFCIYEHMEEQKAKLSLKTIASYLALSRWDPYIYEQLADRIGELVDDADQDVIDYLSDNLPKVAQQFYYLPECHDILFDLGVYYHEQGDYPRAVFYYQQSDRYFEEGYSLHFNLGYCWYHQDDYDRADEHFKRALTFAPKDREALEWIDKIQTQLCSC